MENVNKEKENNNMFGVLVCLIILALAGLYVALVKSEEKTAVENRSEIQVTLDFEIVEVEGMVSFIGRANLPDGNRRCNHLKRWNLFSLG